MPMVELEDLVESFLGNPAHALTEAPFVEGFLLLSALLKLLHVLKDDEGGPQELILGGAVEVYAGQVFFELLTLLHDLLELVIVAL